MAEKNCAATKSQRFFNIKTFPSQYTALLFFFLAFPGRYASADPGQISLQNISQWEMALDKEGDSTFTAIGLSIVSLSVGEADDRRSYWVRIATAAYLAEQDKDSEGKVRVDFRIKDWQTLLNQEEIPRLLANGFQGILLEDIDSIVRLEEKDPERFGGSKNALSQWLSDLRKTHPNLILLAKGSEALETAAPYVDGYVVEGIFTAWDPSSHCVRHTTREERDERLDEIENARVIASVPVFDLEYADSRDSAMTRWATQESVKRGFRPFVKIK